MVALGYPRQEEVPLSLLRTLASVAQLPGGKLLTVHQEHSLWPTDVPRPGKAKKVRCEYTLASREGCVLASLCFMNRELNREQEPATGSFSVTPAFKSTSVPSL